MGIVGFNFTRILVEKKGSADGKINITNNVAIKDVESGKFAFGPNTQNGIRYTFEFTSSYEPNMATISLQGEVIAIETEEQMTKIVEEWKKSKKLEKGAMTAVLNHILSKCNVEALILSREVNLPPPIPLPKVQSAAKK